MVMTTLEELKIKVKWSITKGIIIDEIKDDKGNNVELKHGDKFDDFY